MRWLLAVALSACADHPTPTGTVCADPDPITGSTTDTWENFGQPFMSKYCTMCHASTLTLSHRNGAPLYHDFDTVLGVVMLCEPDGGTAIHIDEQAGWGPKAKNNFMPVKRCPTVAGGAIDEDCVQPTGDERTRLALWVACECQRPHALP